MVEKRAPFAVRSTDVPAVSSALSAAERSWKRGENAAVLRWVQRAAEAASEAEDNTRALELAKCARELAAQLTKVGRTPVPEVPPVAPPSSVHLLTKLAQPRGGVDSPPGSERATSMAGAVSRGRVPGVFEEDTNQVAIFQLRGEVARRQGQQGQVAPKRTPAEAQTRAHARDEWSIETVAGGELPSEPMFEAPDPDPESEPLQRAPAPAPTFTKVPVRATEAVRVLLWRDADGALYVTTAGAPAPPHAVEAMLTSLDPSTDLVALLEDPTT